jgi:hypothetical protein
MVLIMVPSYRTGSLKPIWLMGLACLAGILTLFQAYRIRDWRRAGAAQRAFQKQRKAR